MAFPLPETITAGTTTGHAADHVDIHKLLNSTINSQAGTSYTLVAADLGKVIQTTSASAVTITVPPNSSVAFAVGTVVEVVRMGTGSVTVAAGGGVTIPTPPTPGRSRTAPRSTPRTSASSRPTTKSQKATRSCPLRTSKTTD